MELPPAVRPKAESTLAAYCAELVPFRVRDEVRVTYGFRGDTATIYEERPHFQDPAAAWTRHPVAQMRYDRDAGTWALFWRRATRRWQCFEEFSPTSDIDRVLAEIDANPHGIFWG